MAVNINVEKSTVNELVLGQPLNQLLPSLTSLPRYEEEDWDSYSMQCGDALITLSVKENKIRAIQVVYTALIGGFEVIGMSEKEFLSFLDFDLEYSDQSKCYYNLNNGFRAYIDANRRIFCVVIHNWDDLSIK